MKRNQNLLLLCGKKINENLQQRDSCCIQRERNTEIRYFKTDPEIEYEETEKIKDSDESYETDKEICLYRKIKVEREAI